MSVVGIRPFEGSPDPDAELERTLRERERFSRIPVPENVSELLRFRREYPYIAGLLNLSVVDDISLHFIYCQSSNVPQIVAPLIPWRDIAQSHRDGGAKEGVFPFDASINTAWPNGETAGLKMPSAPRGVHAVTLANGSTYLTVIRV